MKQQIITILLLVTLVQGSVIACDICGCFMINQRAGLLAKVNADFINIAYANVHFKGSALSYDRDVFQNVLISAQRHIGQRWAIGISQGYAYNVRQGAETNITAKGFGNFTMQAFYNVTTKQYKNTSFSWRTGGGVRMPIGDFDQHIHDRDIPESFNPSDGSWGGQWVNDFTWTYKDFGLLMSTLVLLRAEDPTDAKLGDQGTINLNAFYHVGLANKRMTLVPFIGIALDHAGYNQYASGRNDRDTGGDVGLFSLGFNFDNQTIGAGVQYMIPAIWSLNGSGLEPSPRWTAQVSYFFN